MLPFDMDVITPPVSTGATTFDVPVLAPIVKDFDPSVEKLAFTLPTNDEHAVMRLLDLADGSGVEVEVAGRLVVTLQGCVANDIPEDCLTFEFEDED